MYAVKIKTTRDVPLDTRQRKLNACEKVIEGIAATCIEDRIDMEKLEKNIVSAQENVIEIKA
jgi:hypothetical protein